MKFIDNRKAFFSISLAVIIIGLLAMPLNSVLGNGILNYDIEFQGGTLMHVDIGQEVDIENDIRPIVTEVTEDSSPNIVGVTGKDEVIIKTTPTTAEEREELFGTLKEKYNLEDDAQIEVGDVTPTVSGEMKAKALQAIIISTILMLVYISFRFKDSKMGISAVLALIHDVLIVFAVYSIFRIPINSTFIAVMLTILGYSINDTIVIFDRIRENRGKSRQSNGELVNTSIKQTLARTINTSITTLSMVVLLYVFGTAAVREFALPLVAGIGIGTYSSLFISSQLWYELSKYKPKRKSKA